MSDRFFRTWEVEGRPRGVVALVHGIAEHSGRYDHVAERLNLAGYSVLSVDIRGHGRSPGWPGQVERLDEWLDDVAVMLHRARETAGAGPVFLLGHSLGALLAATYVIRNPQSVDGIVLSGAAVLAGQAYIEAAAREEGVPPETISRDPDVVRRYVEDPLVFFDQVSPEANALALQAAIEVNTCAGEIRLPILMLHGKSDLIADVQGARDLFDQIASTDKRLEVYEDLYHEVFNEPERDAVLDDLVGWLDAHTSG